MKNVIYIIYIVLSTYLSQFLASIILNIFDSGIYGNLEEILYYIMYIILEIFFIFWIPKKIWKHSPDEEDLGLKGLPTFTDLGLAPVAFVVVYILTNISSVIFSNFTFFDSGQVQNIGMSNIATSFEKIIFFVILCIVMPIIEELVFRGIIYSEFKKIFNKKFGVIISAVMVSLIFAAMHGQWNVAIMAFWLSIAACSLREITGSCHAGIMLHIMKNAIAFILTYVVIA